MLAIVEAKQISQKQKKNISKWSEQEKEKNGMDESIYIVTKASCVAWVCDTTNS